MTRIIKVSGGKVVSDTAGEYAAPPAGEAARPAVTLEQARDSRRSQRHIKHQRLAGREYPSLIKQGINFGAAMTKWLGSGFKTRPAEEIQRLAEICRDCPSGFFDAEQERCTQCGCPATTKSKWLNKLAVVTEKCPAGHW